MKELSFFLLKNSFGAKMRKGFKNFCNGDGSTSTLNQHKPLPPASVATIHSHPFNKEERQPTLEEMILRLDLEEKMARRSKLHDDDGDGDDDYGFIKHRMSCVNSSDVLRTARNALNQYPRFSLDGKDSMYRSSFRNRGLRKEDGFDSTGGKKGGRWPAQVAGVEVVWCKPGAVAALMGLEAVPVPVSSYYLKVKKKSRRRRQEVEERRGSGVDIRRGMMMGSCSSTSGYCIVKPVAVEDAGWPMRRFL